MLIDNQIILITGGASGIGLGTAQYFKAQGARVAVLDRASAMPAGIEVDAFISCDVRDEGQIEQAVSQIINTIGTPRVLINCAGIAPAKRMVGKEGPMPLSNFKDVIEINLIGTFNVMRVVTHAMSVLDPIDGERGVIINTASIAAFEGQIGQMAYSASKGGVVAMTLPAARELSQFGIRVNTIAPGLIATPMLLNMPQEVQDSLSATIPYPKRFGKPSEYAALAEHLIQNQMINGEVIRLDGALRMQPK